MHPTQNLRIWKKIENKTPTRQQNFEKSTKMEIDDRILEKDIGNSQTSQKISTKVLTFPH